MKVPFIDLEAQHQPIRDELRRALYRVMDDGAFILGEEVTLFEQEFAGYCGASYAVGVDCGLSALKLALLAFGIGAGDEVVIPANTFIATASAVTFTGARPVLVDVDATTFNIDVTQIESAITPRTRAIIPVHLYGQAVDMDPVMDTAACHDLIVIEDACQAHGARYKGRSVGSIGHAAAFSFYPSKNLGAFGDGGIVVTSDSEVANRVQALRNYGQEQRYVHSLEPHNHRLDTIQASVLRIKLRQLDEWNEARRSMARTYESQLSGGEVVTPSESPDFRHVYHLYVIRVRDRESLQRHLREEGIDTGIHYPTPVHLQPYYANSGYRQGQFPVAEQLSGEILSLPMFPAMLAEQVEYVGSSVLAHLSGSQKGDRKNRQPKREEISIPQTSTSVESYEPRAVPTDKA